MTKVTNKVGTMNSIGKQTIVTINAGHQAPVELLKLLLDKKPTAFGFSIQNVEDGEPDLSIERSEEIPTLEMLTQMNEGSKPWPVQLYFSYVEGISADSIQPFVLTDSEGDAFMTIAVEGVFSKFGEPTTETEEHNFVTSLIIPTVNEYLELTDYDLPKVLKQLSGDSFNKTSFLSNIDHRAVLSILPIVGDPIFLGKNELGQDYEWGTVSQRHGFGDAKQDPAPIITAAPKKTKGWWKRDDVKAADGVPVEPIKEEPKEAPKEPAKEPQKQEPKPSVPTVQPKKEEPAKSTAIRPPSWCHSNQDCKNFYKALGVPVPQNLKKRLPVIPLKNADLDFEKMDSKSLQALVLQIQLANSQPKTSAAVTPAPAEVKAADAKNLDKAIEDRNLTILDKKKLDQALDFVDKYLDGNGQVMDHPKESQKLESKIPTLSESLGYEPLSVLNWPRGAIFAFAEKNQTAMAMAFIEVVDLLRPHVKAPEAKVEATTTVTETVSDDGNKTVKTESVAKSKGGKWWPTGKKVA